MNNYFDFNSKKYMLLLVLVCLVFAILVIKAFDFLPDTYVVDTNDNEVANVNTGSNTVINTEPNKTNEENKPVQKSGVLYRSSDMFTADENADFDVIDAPKGIGEEGAPKEIETEKQNVSLSQDDSALKSIINARKYASTNNATASLNEYKNAVINATDNEIKAEALEGIALLYAKNKKYNTALSFADKANKTSPSASREMLIAQIYYSAGKTDTAIKRIRQILDNGIKY